MGFGGHDIYSVVLLPIEQTDESGGESYRRSFAFTFNAAPTSVNRSAWGKTIAHEIFHYWNGWRLRGSDYASSQWFQEGFTEYAANLAMAGSGLITPDEFLQQLSTHIRNYQKLTTPLDAPGSRKGPPLYSGGALVAFCWDLQIRHASGGKRHLGDFLRALWHQTNSGQRAYEWRDIRGALDNTAQLDWEAFYRDYINGTKPLPLQQILPHAGLRLVQAADGFPLIEPEPAAPVSARSLWRSFVKGR
jgi:predicted metalloprotease with PDZ domain